MQQKMENLKELQQIENDIITTLSAQRKLKDEGVGLTTEFEKIQEIVNKLTTSFEAVKKETRELQEAFTQGQDRIQKSEKRLPEIRTTKEYAAVMKEIDVAKKSNHEVQEKIKLLESDLESVRGEKEESEKTLDEIQQKLAERDAEIAPQMEELDKQLSARTKSRECLLSNLSSALKKRYQALIEQRGGIAVVEARNGACLGCHMRLPPQFFNSLYSTEEITSCPHCNRFLYVKPEEKG